MKTLEDERNVVIKAYKCTVSEIWRDFFVLACIACTEEDLCRGDCILHCYVRSFSLLFPYFLPFWYISLHPDTFLMFIYYLYSNYTNSTHF